MVRRHSRVSKQVLFAWLILAGFICMFLPQTLTTPLHLAFYSLYKFVPSLGKTVPLAAVASQPLGKSDQASGYTQLQTKCNQLQNYCANLWAELVAEHQKADKLAGLRTRFPALSGAALVNADIISTDSKSKRCRLIINRGISDGLKKDQFALAQNSVIGKVSELSSRTAVIRLVTDKNFSIPVEVAGPKMARGLMKGDGKGFSHIKGLTKKIRIDKNAPVYACKVAGICDVPLIVGKVAQCRPDDDNPLLWDITVKSAVDLDTITSVGIVIMNP